MLRAVTPERRADAPTAVARLPRVWLAISFVGLLVGFVLTFDASFVDAQSTVVTLLPFMLLPTIAVAYTRLPADGPSTAMTVATLASIAAWTVLILDDERWSALSFALYGLAFSNRGRRLELPLAGLITIIWMIASVVHDGPAWLVFIPVAALIMGVVAWRTFVRADDETTELTRLVDELRATQANLAASEREKGMLEERARVAGEIHDTLAQGFTSIVVLARSARRTGDTDPALDDIESVAADSLQTARRLVAAMGPAELDSVSLPQAIERHLDGAAGERVETHFELVGAPQSLGGAAEEALLRAVQETVLNAERHGEASNVHVTLAYLDDRAALDVVDDGIGFEAGEVSDRGDLTGGQGLAAIRHRVAALGGSVDIETEPRSGTAISIQIPRGTT
ncbi:MAG: sensor histidine kinase [Actinomycetota bacterium]